MSMEGVVGTAFPSEVCASGPLQGTLVLFLDMPCKFRLSSVPIGAHTVFPLSERREFQSPLEFDQITESSAG